ncbi:hypothetical protein AB0C70_18150 [Streptomyces sp. NPDC048564]
MLRGLRELAALAGHVRPNPVALLLRENVQEPLDPKERRGS